MRAIIALLVVFVSVSSFANENYGLNWLVTQDLRSVSVQGHDGSLLDVINDLSQEELTVELCRDFGSKISCSLVFAGVYLVDYQLKQVDGQYQVVSPARLIIQN